ncbi:hypothetical protein CXG81DRAFT_20286 [Caulochytrium protostelioides]|uniref:Pex19-domain-containing protein n=1 Tax=Caulochytrium protostelioides TaxID=1555241 RepID=A0A4P9X3Q8_9FUNG|nr:hypothetical protein CXG81DRAFT_20286 [Caulochytrium protostelioides]|eukprot:RKO99662.1 hypothetical protein CXG81DRAFT_20286 [Caulochytrium protostelioides]
MATTEPLGGTAAACVPQTTAKAPSPSNDTMPDPSASSASAAVATDPAPQSENDNDDDDDVDFLDSVLDNFHMEPSAPAAGDETSSRSAAAAAPSADEREAGGLPSQLADDAQHLDADAWRSALEQAFVAEGADPGAASSAPPPAADAAVGAKAAPKDFQTLISSTLSNLKSSQTRADQRAAVAASASAAGLGGLEGLEGLEGLGGLEGLANMSEPELEALLTKMEALMGGAGGGAGGADGADGSDGAGLADALLEQFMTRDLLYEPLKDLADRYPAWLDAHPGAPSAAPPGTAAQRDDHAQRTEQLRIIREILAVFDEADDADSDGGDDGQGDGGAADGAAPAPAKSARQARLGALMTQMQACGAPPDDLLASVTDGDAKGDASGNGASSTKMPDLAELEKLAGSDGLENILPQLLESLEGMEGMEGVAGGSKEGCSLM